LLSGGYQQHPQSIVEPVLGDAFDSGDFGGRTGTADFAATRTVAQSIVQNRTATFSINAVSGSANEGGFRLTMA
jgi:hypothetical protein